MTKGKNMKAIFQKNYCSLVPVDEAGMQLLEKIKIGSHVEVEVKRKRNYEFHKKYFSLLNYAFENWEHEEVFYKGVVVQDNFDVFRENVLIMAGYGYPVVNLKQEVRFIAKSISFAKMEQDEFEDLYSKTIDAILANVLCKHSEQDLINGVLGYA